VTTKSKDDLEREAAPAEEDGAAEAERTEVDTEPEPNSDATEPNSDATEPNSDATEPNSDATEPKSDATEPDSEITEPDSEITEPDGDAAETEHDVASDSDGTSENASAEDEAGPVDGSGRDRARRLVPVVLAALVAVSAVAVAVLGWWAYGDARDRRAQDDALAAARVETAQVLSYDARTLDADLAGSRTLVTGGFAARFEELANNVIVPAVRQRNLTTKATVTRGAVIDGHRDQVRALLFVKQVTTLDGQPAPREVSNQVRVTMTRAGGRWLISDLQPL
jgi:Mce-associated membrane protein